MVKTIKYYNLTRVDKAYLIAVTEDYIDYKNKEDEKGFYFAYLDKAAFGKEWDHVFQRIRDCLVEGKLVSLVMERRPGSHNPKQWMDYVIKIFFW